MNRSMACSISDDWTYKGMRVIWLENALVKIGILADRGSDIFEFTYKPANLNVLLNMPSRLRNVLTDHSQMRDTTNQFEDHYYGGWQEILPNSPAFNYRGASLGQHGEVSLIPWSYQITHNTEELVGVKLQCSPVRVPITITKEILLRRNSGQIEIHEELVNNGNTDIDIMWGHHIAFGGDFIREGVTIETNAESVLAEPEMPEQRLLQSNRNFSWPEAIDTNGQPVDISKVPPIDQGAYSELAYLSGYEGASFYSIRNESKDLAFRVDWDAEVFKHVWYWQERGAIKDFPWWGNCYTVALEPWTSKWTSDPQSAIDAGEWLHINAKEKIVTSLKAGVA